MVLSDERATPVTTRNPSAAPAQPASADDGAAYARTVDEAAIRHAEAALSKLLGGSDLAGCSFLDIGCGFGVHALAAARLGARSILAIDLDPQSVAISRALLEAHRVGVRWQVEEINLFDLDSAKVGPFDVVHSWGALQSTGQLLAALSHAASLTAPGGLLILGLYRRTLLDGFWMREKRWYSGTSPRLRKLAQNCFLALLRVRLAARGRSLDAYRRRYRSRRGASLSQDVNFWLGSHPYEPISAAEVNTVLTRTGFKGVRRSTSGPRLGLLGSDCNEYVYRRRAG